MCFSSNVEGYVSLPTHIKLGLMKIFLKFLDTEGIAFFNLRDKFKCGRGKRRGFIGLQIKAVFHGEEFENKL